MLLVLKFLAKVPNRYTITATALASTLTIVLGTVALPVPSHAQQAGEPLTQALIRDGRKQDEGNVENELLQEVLEAPPEVIETIRNAPFSDIFTVALPNGGTAYAIKDKDFSPNYKSVGLYTLWGDAPEIDLLQVSVFYCFRNQAIANAMLEEIAILDGSETLVTLDQGLVATQAQDIEIVPERYEPATIVSDPFYSPFWMLGYSGDIGDPTYVPAENCSVGGGRFDLRPVQDAIAQLPNKTLDIRLEFNNGEVETWRLGRGTVEEMKSFPSLQ